MNSILAELENKSIITADAVARIKSHIVCKNPDMPVSRRAVILADALNKILDQNLSHFGEEHIRKLKRLLLEHAVKRQRFEVFCSDAFQAAVELKESGEDFFDGLDAWLSSNSTGHLSKDRLVGLVLESHRLMELSPSMSMAQTIAAAEAMIQTSVNDDPIAPANESLIAPVDKQPNAPANELSAARADKLVAPADEPQIASADDLVALDKAAEPSVPAYAEVFEAGSASYAAKRLKAISRKASAHMENGESQITANELDESRMTAITEAADGTDAADKQVKPGETYFGYLSQVYVVKSGYRGRRNKWMRLPAAAAAMILLITGLAFGIGRFAADSITAPEQIAAAGQAEYEYTTLLDEDIAASQNNWDEKNSLKMKATAYDLSVESCGKKPGDPGYGITCSGTRATVGRTVAVDPEVIPLGSRLMINFPDEYSHLDGIYIAEDTGRLIKGTSIDIFFGEDARGSTDVYDAAMAFGIRYVDVWILEDFDSHAS